MTHLGESIGTGGILEVLQPKSSVRPEMDFRVTSLTRSVATEGITTMKRIAGLTLSGIFLTGALAHAQAPIVKLGTSDAPPTLNVKVQATPVPMPTPIPTTMPMPPMAASTAPEAPAAPAVEEPKVEEEKKPEDKFLLQKLLESSPAGQTLAGNGWKIYGWTQGSFTTGSVRNSTLPVPFINRAEQFSLNQNWLHVEKGIDTSKKEFQIGGTADLIIPGTDYQFTPSRGLLTARQSRGEDYGIDLFQGFISMFLPNLGSQGTTLQVGKFATPCEYETVQAISTPFVSRSYLFQYNPFTHTGVNAITPLNDNWTISNALVLGSDNFFNDATRLTYVGSLKWAPKDGKTTVLFNTVITDPSFDGGRNFAFYNLYNLQLIHKLTDKLTYVADGTYSHIDKVPDIGFANWYGVANYLLYDVNDKIQTKLRVELFDDAQGFRTGSKGLYTATTAGITWKPAPWIYVMPEVRYDHNSGNNPTGPFEGNRNMFTATLGAILRF